MAQPGYGEGLLILWSYDHGSSNLPPHVPLLCRSRQEIAFDFSIIDMFYNGIIIFKYPKPNEILWGNIYWVLKKQNQWLF